MTSHVISIEVFDLDRITIPHLELRFNPCPKFLELGSSRE